MKTKKSIAPVLRAMEIGNIETYPAERLTNVRNTIYRLQWEEVGTYSTSVSNGFISVKRTS